MVTEYKRFLVFGYESYYPQGGLVDVQATFDAKQEAIKYALEECEYENIEIFDTVKREEIEW